MKKSEIYFWLFFLGLNFLLFVPHYALEANTSTFFPYGFLQAESWTERFMYFFKRDNYDIFRISLDLTYVVTLLFLIRNYLNNILTALLVTLFYLILLLNQIYLVVFEQIYQVNPLFFNDLSSIKTALDIVFERFSFRLVLILLAIVMMIAGIYWGIQSFLQTLKRVQFGNISWPVIRVLIFIMLYSQIRFGYAYTRDDAFPNIIASITENIRESLAYKRKSEQIDVAYINQQNDIQPVKLHQKPNIYLLFIESYGRYVYDNPDIIDAYRQCLVNNEAKLQQNDWHSYSALSTSPVSGGISWVSYSSVLYGFNMKNQGLYDFYLNNEQLLSYTNMTRFFKQCGYTNYRLNSLYPHKRLVIPWEQYTRFYAVDQWITFDDLDFNGKMYGFGPTPPDQYSLNYAVEEIINPNSGPFTLFFLTQNSHWPFYAPDSVATNWRNLNTGTRVEKPKSQFIHRAEREDYMKSIAYQLNYITEFITRSSGHNLFLVIGDHQPPILTTKNEGFETPVHIISQDSAFISGFADYGLSRGLVADTARQPIKHESIYSMVTREFLRNYSHADSLPAYRPNGLDVYE